MLSGMTSHSNLFYNLGQKFTLLNLSLMDLAISVAVWCGASLLISSWNKRQIVPIMLFRFFTLSTYSRGRNRGKRKKLETNKVSKARDEYSEAISAGVCPSAWNQYHTNCNLISQSYWLENIANLPRSIQTHTFPCWTEIISGKWMMFIVDRDARCFADIYLLKNIKYAKEIYFWWIMSHPDS